jgi:hypothetical protein
VAGEGVDEAAGKEAVGAGALEHADRITAMATIRDEIRRPLI